MSIESIQDMALPEIPDLEGRISTCREQVPSIGMEVNLVNLPIMGIIVLNESLTPDIPNLDGPVLAATGHAGSVGVESNRVDPTLVVLE